MWLAWTSLDDSLKLLDFKSSHTVCFNISLADHVPLHLWSRLRHRTVEVTWPSQRRRHADRCLVMASILIYWDFVWFCVFILRNSYPNHQIIISSSRQKTNFLSIRGSSSQSCLCRHSLHVLEASRGSKDCWFHIDIYRHCGVEGGCSPDLIYRCV